VSRFFTIWRRELTACFLSPVAYVTMVIFLSVSGWVFVQAVEGKSGTMESLEVLLFMSIFFWVPILTTVISMRLLAEEKRMGTLETLMTAPVTDGEVILGKYAGALSFLFIVIYPSVSYIFILKALSPGLGAIDVGGVIGGCLMLALVCTTSVAIGLLVSLLTKNQIVAAICIFCAVWMPFFVRQMGSILPFESEKALDYLSIESHIMDFARGSVDTRPVILYLSSTVFILFVTVRLLEMRRWK
jgi:ABC-2 type transport system permease protein